jgi:predicted DNA-binding protein
MDTFNDMTPIEEPTQEVSNDGGMETFDNMEPITEDVTDGEQEQSSKTEDKQTAEEKQDDSQVKQLDEEEESDKKADEGDASKSDVDKKEDSTEDKPAEEKTETAPKGPTLRVKNGDESVDISPEATVKVKVNGKNEFVPVKELMTNYSGKVAYDEKFEKIQSETKEFTKEKEEFTAYKDNMVGNFKEIFGKLEDPETNPMEALTYLLDIAGKPVHTYMKRVMEHQLGELEKLQEMDETEMSLYWTQQENEYLRSNQATQAKREESQKTKMELDSKISDLRERHGVSEEEFSTVRNELIEQTGSKDVSPEDVVQYAKFKPLHSKAQGYVNENFEDQLGDTDLENLTAETARVMFTVGKLNEEEAVKIAARNLGFEIETEADHLKNLEGKKQEEIKIPKAQGKVAPENEFETFDDFNY